MKKIALPVTKNGQINDHFGHCEFYKIYTVSESNEIIDEETIESGQGCGCKSNIAITLAKAEVSIMLAGGIGEGAINVLNSAGIKVIRGCSGNSLEVVKQYIEGKIADSGSSCHSHEHQCNSH